MNHPAPRRLPDWDRRLVQFVTATRSLPYVLSTHDCGSWALQAVDAMCGTDYAAELAGKYTDPDGARAYAALRGWATLADAAVEYGGIALRSVLIAQRGDLIALPAGNPASDDEGHGLGGLGLCFGAVLFPVPAGAAGAPLRSFTLSVAARVPGVVAYAMARPTTTMEVT